MKRTRITPCSNAVYHNTTLLVKDRAGKVINTAQTGNGSVPSNGFSWIVDECPHPRGRITNCEHLSVRHEPSLPGSPLKYAENYESLALAAQDYPRTYCPDYWLWRQTLVGPMGRLPRAPLEVPYWPTFVGSLQVSNAIAGLKSRVSRLGLGRAGLAESIGELPDTPHLFKMVSLSKGLIANSMGLYLGAKFGWRPLLDLIEPVADELHRFRSGLRASRKQNTGSRTLTFSTSVLGSDAFSYLEQRGSRFAQYPKTFFDLYSTQMSSQTRVQYMVEVDVKRKPCMPPVADYLGSVDGLMNLRTMWELIPLSFVVDMFIGVGDLVSRLQGNLLYDIKIKEEAWALRHTCAYKTGFVQGGEDNLLATTEIEYYYRSTTLPVLSCLPEIRWPSVDVIPTFLALGLQRYSKYLDKLLTVKRSGASLSVLTKLASSWTPQGGIMKQRPNAKYYLNVPRR